MEAIDAALGRPLRYAVVTTDGLIYRESDGTDRLATDDPAWVAVLREESAMRHQLRVIEGGGQWRS